MNFHITSRRARELQPERRPLGYNTNPLDLATELIMFKHAKPFSGFSVNDLEKARAFYRDTLELDVADGPMDNLELQLDDDTRVFIYEKPNHVAASFTILNFPVDDVDRAVEQLKERGVRFEVYKSGDIATDEKGVHRDDDGGPKIAWFKDPAGNFLSVLEAE